MRDLTQGSIIGHLLSMAGFILIGMLFQTLYFIVDLYFVSHLGAQAIAGVSAGGTMFFLSMAIAQMLGVGSLSLVAQAIGRKDAGDANLVFNQAFALALAAAAALVLLGITLIRPIMHGLTADAGTAEAGRRYLLAFLPGLALNLPTAVLGSVLRAAGVVKSPMIVSTATLVLNIVLAPVLIAGWGTGAAFGVTGAGLASSIAISLGFVAMLLIFPRVQSVVRAKTRLFRIDLATLRRIVGIGLPAAAEFGMMFVIFSVVYISIQHFGAAAQAGYGIGQRLMQAMLLPGLAISFAVAPVAGQNFGAGKFDRVRETMRTSAILSVAAMALLGLFCHLNIRATILPFSADAQVVDFAETYMEYISISFIFAGLTFACSGIFQALGDTRPSLTASASRLVTFAAPALWLSATPGVRIEDIWLLSIASSALQALAAYVFVRRLMRLKLGARSEVRPAPAE